MIVATCFALQTQDVWDGWNDSLLDLRQRAVPTQATGQVILVAIDSESLAAIGEWPWSRSVHADLLNRLVAANAGAVFFDVDFAFAGDAAGDLAFAQALEQAGGGTYLASFAQTNRTGTLSYSEPYAPFNALSWPAFSTVRPNNLGQIRQYPLGGDLGGIFVPSAAVLLAGGFATDTGQVEINYAISPQTVPVYPVVDVLSGRVSPDQIAGRAVIIGATAVQLGDTFAVPLHQVISGAMLHALAAETLLQDAAILRGSTEATFLGLGGLLIFLQFAARGRPWRMVGALFGTSILIEGGSLLLFANTLVSLPTAMAHPALVLFGMGRMAQSLDFARLLIQTKDMEIENRQAMLSHLFEHSAEGFIVISGAGQVILQNHMARSLFAAGIDGGKGVPDEIIQRARTSIQNGDRGQQRDIQPCYLAFESAHGTRTLEYVITTATYSDPAPDARDMAAVPLAMITVRDVTEARKKDQQIAFLSNHDERTGALRRRAFHRLLQAKIADAIGFTAFSLKLKRLKTINRTLGRDVGDLVLAQVVERLSDPALGLSQIVRLDGDCFGFLADRITQDAQVADMVTRILNSVCAPYALQSANAQVGAQVGYAIVDRPSDQTPERIVQMIEEALDAPRTATQSQISRYNPEQAERRKRMREIERAMPAAIADGEFFLLYQPQHDLADLSLTGVEALVRWRSPTLGEIMPDEFIQIAESTGYIVDLGRFILERSISDAAKLPAHIKMSPNVSVEQLIQADLVADIASLLGRYGVAPDQLCLELTESMDLDPHNASIETMHDIARTGVSWALDDFGTGYSSLSYLQALPFSKVKLDRSFIINLEADESAQNTVRAISALCHSYGMSLLCEGVETRAQLEILKRSGCQTGQGYYFGRPGELAEILSVTDNKAGQTVTR